jgi:Dolichyl-phosphate-mannose-protein mannosyltransferase
MLLMQRMREKVRTMSAGPPNQKETEAAAILPAISLTKIKLIIAIALLGLWALLYLPNLRTNPNWYGDEGEWMDKSWTFIHGTPRVGPITNDFVFPYPYPPLYMLVNGALLRIFGNDLLVGRSLGAVTALAAAGALFWIGSRLLNTMFGFLCAAALLVYPEAVINFRWVRSHPMAGTLSLISVGFLIQYVQRRRLRDVALAGGVCSLATATNYFTLPLAAAVIATAAFVNRGRWREALAWRDLGAATGASVAYAAAFVLWYTTTHSGIGHLMEQMHRLGGMTRDAQHALWVQVLLIGRRIVVFIFATPITHGTRFFRRDYWLVAAAVGIAAFPVVWVRGWLVFWLVMLMLAVFRIKKDPRFFYPAMIFLPVMAVGVAATAERMGRLATWVFRKESVGLRVVPGCMMLAIWAAVSLRGAWGHFESKIDEFTQQSVPEAEAAMRYVNTHTTAQDFVLLPKQIYWLAKTPRKSMLTHCVTYDGGTNDVWPVVIPRELFWFDASCSQAKYVVIASGMVRRGQVWKKQGFDFIYTIHRQGVLDRVSAMLEEAWPIVYVGGERWITVEVMGKKWPVAVNGEYIVLANPKLVQAAERRKR